MTGRLRTTGFGGPVRQHRWGRAVASVLALLAITATLGPGIVSASVEPEDDGSTAPIRVTAVDATSEIVELSVIGAGDGVTASQVALTSGDEPLTVSGVTSALASGVPSEVVLVVDVNSRGIQGGALETIKRELAAGIGGLAPGASVGIVAAGDSALVESGLAGGRDEVVSAVEALSPRNGAALFKAVQRAGGLFSDAPGVNRSILVISTGGDIGSDRTPTAVQADLVGRGIQLVSLRYRGGEESLAAVASASGGLDLDVDSPEALTAGISRMLAVASDRLIVSFSGASESGTRSNLRLDVAGSVTELSYPAGVAVDIVPQLQVQERIEPTGIAFFRSSIGLYISLFLAFVGISLGIWSVGSLVAGRDSSLERLLSRYADGQADIADDEVEELIVQSALLKRAISFSESFAEKRGFLTRVEDLLEKADLPLRPGEAMFALAAIATFTTAFALILTQSVVGGLLIGIFAVGFSFSVVKYLGRRRFKKFESLLPDTLQLLSGTLRAGYSLPQGMDVVAREIADPMGKELQRAMAEARLGRDIEECLASVAERLSSADFAWAVMAIGIQREVGGNLNELLNSVADTMIARERLRREVGALTAEGRMSAGILSFLPPGLGLVMWMMNPDYIALLFTDFLGNILLGLGTVSAMIGLAWMKKVITIDV